MVLIYEGAEQCEWHAHRNWTLRSCTLYFYNRPIDYSLSISLTWGHYVSNVIPLPVSEASFQFTPITLHKLKKKTLFQLGSLGICQPEEIIDQMNSCHLHGQNMDRGDGNPGINPDMRSLADSKHLDALTEHRQPSILSLVCAVQGYIST